MKVKVGFLPRPNQEIKYSTSIWRVILEMVLDVKFEVYIITPSDYGSNFKKRTIKDVKDSLARDDVKIKFRSLVNKDGELSDQKKLGIDFLFLCSPYYEYKGRNEVTPEKICSNFRVCFLSYALFVTNSVHDISPINNAFRIFANGSCEAEIYNRLISNGDDKIVRAPSVKFDFVREKDVFLNKGNDRKKIIISTHHFHNEQGLSNGQFFLDKKDFLIELPKKFPEVDFVLNPHHSLFNSLIVELGWTEKEVQEWKDNFEENKNAIISTKTYEDLFCEADGIINWGLSFVSLALLSQKPVLFVTKGQKKDFFQPYAQRIINEAYYPGYSEESVINFIENVVIKGEDSLQEARKKVLDREIELKEGGSANFIKNEIKKYADEIGFCRGQKIKELFKSIN